MRPKEGVDLVLQLYGQRVATGKHTHQEGHVQLFQMLCSQQSLKERGHAGNKVRVLLSEQLCIALDGEGGYEDASCTAHESCMNADAQTETVENRHHGQHFQSLQTGITACCDGLQREGVEIIAGQADALCRTSGAAGIENGSAGAVILIRIGQLG